MLRIKEIRLLLCFGHRYRQLRGDAVIELHLNVVAAERLDVGVQVDLALVDVDMRLFQRIGYILARYRAEQLAAFADLDLDRDLSPILVDRGRIKQVLLNILVNAVQSISDAGEIRIHTVSADADGRVRLSVSDSGCGIPESLRERIFDPFFTTKPIVISFFFCYSPIAVIMPNYFS